LKTFSDFYFGFIQHGGFRKEICFYFFGAAREIFEKIFDFDFNL